MKALITGIDGFIGSWLTQELLRQGYQVFGLSRKEGDLLDRNFVEKKIQKTKADIIFHLAAQSSIVDSFSNPVQTVETNVIGTVNILESLRHQGKRTTLLSIGSSAEYGETAHSGRLVTEDLPVKPLSPYAITKVSQEMFCSLYKKVYGLSTKHVRLFAIIGPGKKNDAIGDFARGIAAIEQGKKKILSVGDLTHARDFMDVRDAVRAIIMIAESRSSYDIFNACTGKTRTLAQILDFLKRKAKKTIHVKKDSAQNRPSHDPIIAGSPKRLGNIGFKKKYTIEQTLSDILDYWREEENKK